MTCKDCPNRTVGCHATCEDYLQFKAKQAEIAKKKQAEHLGLEQAIRRSLRSQKLTRKIEKVRRGY